MARFGWCLILLLLSGCSFFLGESGSKATRHPETIEEYEEFGDVEAATSRAFVPLRERTGLPAPARQTTPEVRREVHEYLKGGGRHVTRAINLLHAHRAELTKILAIEGIPPDLLNLVVVECGFNNSLKSPMGAAGMWQFMKSTARAYGLRVDSSVDQRKDPRLSTRAAAKYLNDLYTRYHDWSLALAAYNAGEGAVDRIVRAKGERDFWKLARQGAFKRETVRHVAKFYAVTIILDDPGRFGLQAPAI